MDIISKRSRGAKKCLRYQNICHILRTDNQEGSSALPKSTLFSYAQYISAGVYLKWKMEKTTSLNGYLRL